MNCGLIPPSYLRGVNFHNSTGVDAQVHVTFESGAHETYTAVQNGDLVVERSIDQGSYTTVDPIL